jgi:uncharacterized protein (TIGR02145 family)
VGANGKPLKNSTVGLRLSVLDSLPTGSTLYTETQAASTDASGQFSIFLGGGTATVGTFANLPWANGNDKFLKVEMDAQGGSNYLPMGTTQLVSVPYAMASKVADTAQVAKEIEIGTVIRGNAGRTWQLTESINGPAWKCYPPVTQANAGADQLNVCGNIVTISGNTSAGMTPAWSINSGTGGILNGNTFTGIRGNVYSLRYTLTNACGTTADTLQISMALPATAATAGPDQLSLKVNTAALAANTPAAGQTGRWTITTSGSGATLSNINTPTATFTKGIDSAYTLVWTITGPCGNSRDTIKLLFPTNFCSQSAVSYAGESYPTVQIGTQCWLAKNLNVGTMIQASNQQINNSTLEKYCYNNDPANCTTYGGLYQWAEAVQYQNGASNSSSPNPAFTSNVRGICPTGWHLPSDAEWGTLGAFLGGNSVAGGALKSTSGLWQTPNTGATNSSGFSALPGGFIFNYPFSDLGKSAIFWSTNEISNHILIGSLSHIQSNFSRIGYLRGDSGFSVRCIQD